MKLKITSMAKWMTMEESVPESVVKKQQNSNTRFLPKELESERLEITKLPKIFPMTFKALIQPFRTEVRLNSTSAAGSTHGMEKIVIVHPAYPMAVKTSSATWNSPNPSASSSCSRVRADSNCLPFAGRRLSAAQLPLGFGFVFMNDYVEPIRNTTTETTATPYMMIRGAVCSNIHCSCSHAYYSWNMLVDNNI